MHLAAQVDVRQSIADPALDAQVNVAGTVSVLEAARETGARRVLMASTAAVYGDPQAIPTPETAPIASLSPYGTSKAAAEWYLGQCQRLHGISTLALRMANVYGPRQDPHGEAGVVSIICGVSAEGGRATVYGSGWQTRDYVFIDDAVAAWLAAAEGDVTGALNVSTSVLDVLEALDLPHDLAPGHVGEIERSCLDPTAAAERLRWSARVPLAEGCAGHCSPCRRPVERGYAARPVFRLRRRAAPPLSSELEADLRSGTPWMHPWGLLSGVTTPLVGRAYGCR